MFANISLRHGISVFLLKSNCINTSIRCCSTFSSSSTRATKKVVYFSQSDDIFSNLALEEWIYKNWQIYPDRPNVLLIWRNAPCVVIGKHQNPFKEANLEYLKSEGIPFARRQSGGGAVYHDMGNINFSFFSPRNG